MYKKVLFSSEVRESMLKGVNILADSVKVTMGPKGRNAVIDKGIGSPLITNDGVSIAKEIELKDKFEDMGAKLVYEVANKTNDIAGDGTTTATVLAQSMIENGFRNIESGSNPVLMKEGIEFASKAVANYIVENSKKVNNLDDILNVASISAGSNKLGKYIEEAVKKVGRNGVITIEESNEFDTYVEVTEGLNYDKGYISPNMLSEGEIDVKLDNPLILITDKKINSIQEILQVLEIIIEENKCLLIIADDYGQDVISALILNKLNNTFNVIATKTPSFVNNKNEILKDIAIITGAKFYSRDLYPNAINATKEELGSAKKIKVTKDNTTIINGNGSKEKIKTRIKEIETQIEDCKNDYERKKLKERLGNINNGIAILKVGGATETEMKEKKLRLEDALNATKSAIKEGIVIGGGVTLVNAYSKLKGELKNDNTDIQNGIDIVLNAILEPMRQIIKNAGLNVEEILNKQLKSEKGIGYDAKNNKWVKMIDNGIIDPALVTRTAVLNAASISSLFITTEVGIVIDDENGMEKDLTTMDIF